MFNYFKKPSASATVNVPQLTGGGYQPQNTHPILTARELLAPRLAAVNRIEELAGVPEAHFRRFYLACLENYAAFVQQLPASEAHHHGHVGGMLDHALEACIDALTLRQGYLLPPGTQAEDIVNKKDLWTYAVFTGSLCHDLAKPAVDQVINLYDTMGISIGLWDPWHGNMAAIKDAWYYGIQFVNKREYRLHEKAALLLVGRIIPTCGLSWLAGDRQAFSCWLSCLSGHYHEADALGEIISLGDRHSVAKDLGAEPKAQAAKPTILPLPDKLLMALRQLLEEKALPLNRNGAAGWRKGAKLWLVSKRTVDSMRLYLSQSGHTGIPTDNQRLFDVLQEHHILEPCQGRAIWRTEVKGDGWGHELTLICIPLAKLWPDAGAWPEEFTGTVSAADTGDGPINATLALTDSLLEAGTFDNELAEPPSVESVPGECKPNTSKTVAKASPKSEPNDQKDGPEPSLAPDTGNNMDNVVEYLSQRITAKPDHPGFMFLKWVIENLENRKLAFNQPNARVQVVDGGILLVSPGIFQDYVKQAKVDMPWETVQKKFCKLGLHKKSERGLNIHPYQVSGKNRSGKVMALLLEDTSLVFRKARPRANPHVTGQGS